MDDIARMAADWAALEVTRTGIVERQTEIKNILRERLGVGKHPAGILRVEISEQRRFTAEGAKSALKAEPDKLDAITEPMVSTELARRLLTPADYDRCKVASGEPKVAIK